LLCNAHALLCNAHALLCNAHALLCKTHAFISNSEMKYECSNLAPKHHFVKLHSEQNANVGVL
jgi:hypothetical protein